MRSLVAMFANSYLTKCDKKWEPETEIIIVTSEPHFRFDEDFEVKKRRRDLEQFRFMTSEAGLAGFIEALEKARFELQNQTAAAALANNAPPNVADEAE